MIAYGDSAEDGDASAYPDFFAQGDGFGGMAGVADGDSFGAGVVGVAEAGVFADHGAGADGDAGHGYEVDTPGEDYAFAEGDGGGRLGFEVEVGVEEGVFAETNAGGAVDMGRAQDDDGGGEWVFEVGGQVGVVVEAAGRLAQGRGEAEGCADWGDQEGFQGHGK